MPEIQVILKYLTHQKKSPNWNLILSSRWELSVTFQQFVSSFINTFFRWKVEAWNRNITRWRWDFPVPFFFLFVNLMIIGSICLSCLPIESKVVLEGKYRVLQISLACAPAFFYCLAESTSSLLLFSGSAQLSFVFLSTAVLSGLDSLVFVNLILEILLKLIGTGHTWLSLNWLKNSISLTIFVALLTIP